MHDDRAEIEQRLQRMLTNRILPELYSGLDAPLKVEVWHAPGEPVDFATAVKSKFRSCGLGEKWGRAWGTSWFHFTGKMPNGHRKDDLEVVLDLGFSGGPGFTAEGTVWLPDGSTVKGLHPRQRYLKLKPGQTRIDFYVEAAANPDVFEHGTQPTEVGDWDTAGDELLYELRQAEVMVRNAEVAALVADLEVLGQLMAELPTSEARRWEIAKSVSRALDCIDVANVVGTAAAARKELTATLSQPANASAHRITAVGHAHIDSAWLWPLRETVRKVARTVSNVCTLAEDYPDLTFAFSSAQQHAWIKEYYPKVFNRLKQAVVDGVIIPVGGMWVESDTNMVGAEAMCRQFVHGKRFFLDNYGIETDEVWLPDSFGYAAGMPQIVRQSNTSYFLTQKISWSETNKFPHHTFWWEGIDGTRVLTHFPSADTYNSDVSGRELAHASRNYQDKGGPNSSLLPFGFGDGGGGPTREMVERLKRVGDLEGSAKATMGRPDAFFSTAEAEYPDAPVWSGELYLELHRGTLTSQAKTKQGNRRSESLLREAELWSTAATVQRGARYPYADLDRIWKRVLLHQFHDILPGSSIHWVHREAEQAYAEIADELIQLVDRAQLSLAGKGKRAVTFNAAGSMRAGVPALSAGFAHVPGKVKVGRSGRGWQISNGLVTAKINSNGLITSVLDHAADDAESDREVLAGPSNLLQLHPDLPRRWDAWDVDSYYRNRVTDLDMVDEITEVPDGIAVTRSFGSSTVVQTLTLTPGEERVDCTVDVDWHEREKFLKAAFLLDVQAERSAAETQFGHLYRPTHTNTSWESAKFEVVAHRYLHLAEEGYGVALVNDSTYGHDVSRVSLDQGVATQARLSLLRAPRFPDPETDQGRHVLRYALVVGASLADAAAEGIKINIPARTVMGGRDVDALVTVDNPEVVISAVKMADDESGDVIVRAYQATGARSLAELGLGFDAKKVTVVDLLERPLNADVAAGYGTNKIKIEHGVVQLALRPFQLVTLRLSR
ncbi:MAG: alpha-mannosidase [Propionibacteriaceae bacterium]